MDKSAGQTAPGYLRNLLYDLCPIHSSSQFAKLQYDLWGGHLACLFTEMDSQDGYPTKI